MNESHRNLLYQLGQPVDIDGKEIDKTKGSIEEIANYSTSSSEEDDEDEGINLFSDEDKKSLIGTLNFRKLRKKQKNGSDIKKSPITKEDEQ